MKWKVKKIKSKMTISVRSEAYKNFKQSNKLKRGKVSYRENTHLLGKYLQNIHLYLAEKIL